MKTLILCSLLLIATLTIFAVGCATMSKSEADTFVAQRQAEINAANEAIAAAPADSPQAIKLKADAVKAQAALDYLNSHRNPDGSFGSGAVLSAAASQFPFPFNVYGGLAVMAFTNVGTLIQNWRNRQAAQEMATNTAALKSAHPAVATAMDSPTGAALTFTGLNPLAAKLLNAALAAAPAPLGKVA